MELSLTFDIDSNKEDISADFWNAHNRSWKDKENPTNFEFENSIKNEIESWLEDLEIDFVMKQVDNSDNKQQTIDVLWEFISEKDINAIMQKLKEKNL